jgi:hypothetical protein
LFSPKKRAEKERATRTESGGMFMGGHGQTRWPFSDREIQSKFVHLSQANLRPDFFGSFFVQNKIFWSDSDQISAGSGQNLTGVA